MIGGGIGSMAAAAFLVRDGGIAGENITIYEAARVLGGSLDAGGNSRDGYSMRGGRMLTTDNYECTWDLFKSIPSLDKPGMTVFEEVADFNEQVTTHSRARLVDRNRAIVDVTSMGFSMSDRMELLRLAETDEMTLGNSRITDWFSPGFFETKFWFMWATTFAFQPWHSAVEFRRYLHRFMKEFTRIETLAGIKRTRLNQYDSLVRPLQSWLSDQGVRFVTGAMVTALELERTDGKIAVASITVRQGEQESRVVVNKEDRVFLQNASMTDASSLGSMTKAPERLTKARSGGWVLWEALAKECQRQLDYRLIPAV